MYQAVSGFANRKNLCRWIVGLRVVTVEDVRGFMQAAAGSGPIQSTKPDYERLDSCLHPARVQIGEEGRTSESGSFDVGATSRDQNHENYPAAVDLAADPRFGKKCIG